jgi:hypothetical protein
MSVHGFSNSTLYATNVDFRGVTPVVDQMTADGQLLIGSATAPFIRSGFLTSVNNTILFNLGNGTIDLAASGGTIINGDTGVPVYGPNIYVYADHGDNYCGSTVLFEGISGNTDLQLQLSDTNGNTCLGQQSGNASNLLTGIQNTLVGTQCGYSLVGGSGTVAVGNQALRSSVNDSYSTAIGTSALYSLNGSIGLTACGYTALSGTVSDTGCSAFGYQSLAQLNGGGSANNCSAFGYNSLFASFTDSDNSCFGFNTLTNTQGGSFNCAFGSQSMQGTSPSHATRNSAYGYQSLFTSGTNCNSNVAVGAQSLYSTAGDSYCVAIGDGALQNLNGVSGITAVGCQALFSSVQDAQNTALGFQAMYSTNSGGMGGNANVATGYQVMYSNISGSQCLASGFQALFSATTPNSTVAEGYQAMYQSLTSVGCTATGFQALYSSQNDQYHCAYGDSALYSINGSNNCSAFGTDCFGSLVTGQNSSGLGAFVFSNITTGEGNLGLGYSAGSSCTSSDSFNVCIASNGLSGDNGVIRIGDITGSPAQNQFQAAYFCGINQFTQDPLLAGPQVVTISTSNQLGVTSLLSGAIQTIVGDSGSITGNTVQIFANQAILNAGSTVSFSNSGTTSTLNLSDNNQNTIIGNGSGVVAPLFGSGNTILGSGSFNNAASAHQNVGVGAQVLVNCVSDGGLVAIGYQSMYAANGVGQSTATGFLSLQQSVSDSGNSAFGYQSLTFLNGAGSAINNSAFGVNSLPNLVTGSFCVGIGANSGEGYTSSESSNICINSYGVVGESNVGRIGAGTGTANQQLAEFFLSGVNGNTLGGTPLMVVIDSSTDQLGVQAIPTTSVQALTPVTHGASPYTVLTTDQFLSCATSGGVITLLLPNAPVTGQVWTVKDASGAAATSNITVTTVGGAVTIDGVTSYVLNVNYQSISVIFDGASYSVF